MKKIILSAMHKEISYIENHDIILSGIGSLNAACAVIENEDELLEADEIVIFGTLGAYDDTPVGSLVIPDKVINGNSGFNDSKCFTLNEWIEDSDNDKPAAISLNSYHIQKEYENAGFSVFSKALVSSDTWHKADTEYAKNMKEKYNVIGEDMESYGYLFALQKLGLLDKTIVIRIVSNNSIEYYDKDKVSEIVKKVSEYISKE